MKSLSSRPVRPLLQPVGGASDIAEHGGLGRCEATSERSAAEGEIEIENEIGAAREPRVARRPAAPTKAMIQAHELHHAEYREWCEHCVAGKGVAHHHRKKQGQELDEVESSIDYGFITRDGAIEYERNTAEEEKVGAIPVLVGHDHRSKAIWAVVIDQKGPTPAAVKW